MIWHRGILDIDFNYKTLALPPTPRALVYVLPVEPLDKKKPGRAWRRHPPQTSFFQGACLTNTSNLKMISCLTCHTLTCFSIIAAKLHPGGTPKIQQPLVSSSCCRREPKPANCIINTAIYISFTFLNEKHSLLQAKHIPPSCQQVKQTYCSSKIAFACTILLHVCSLLLLDIPICRQEHR